MLVVAALVLVNFSYFWKNISYTINPPSKTTSVNEPTQQQEKIEPNRLIVKKLEIEAPIIYVEEESEEAFQQGLQNGVVHFPKTAKPGETGNVYIFGHSSDYAWSRGSYKTIFALLPRIKTDDQIIVSDSEGNKFIYGVFETKVVATSDVQYLDQPDSEKLLTLQTSYPVGTALKRFIIRARLVE